MSACSRCGIWLSYDGLCQQCYDRWPNCAVSGCQNKCCLRLKSIYCYPHTLGLPTDFLEPKKEPVGASDEPR